MLTLHLEAPSYEALVSMAERELGRQLGPQVLANLINPATGDAPTIEPISTTPPAETRPRGRGRPRTPETPAAAPVAPTASPSTPETVSPSPAVPSPAAGEASQTAPAPATTASAALPPTANATTADTGAVTFDQVKEVLQKVSSRDAGKGLRDVIAILNEFGVQKVKDLKPENYAAVAAKANELLAAS
jgi:hypothetical protein